MEKNFTATFLNKLVFLKMKKSALVRMFKLGDKKPNNADIYLLFILTKK
jgi:hypothetical protein